MVSEDKRDQWVWTAVIAWKILLSYAVCVMIQEENSDVRMKKVDQLHRPKRTKELQVARTLLSILLSSCSTEPLTVDKSCLLFITVRGHMQYSPHIQATQASTLATSAHETTSFLLGMKILLVKYHTSQDIAPTGRRGLSWLGES